MSIADDIAKLKELRDAGDLTDEEYARAKALLLSTDSEGKPPPTSGSGLSAVGEEQNHADESPEWMDELLEPGADSLGRAANRYVSLQMVMAVVGVIFFFLMMVLMLSMYTHSRAEMERMRSPFFGEPYVVTVEP